MPALENAARSACARGDRAAQLVLVLVRPQRLPSPVALLDLLDLLLAHPEIVTDFVNQSLADHRADLVLVLAVLLDRTLVERDAIRQGVSECPGTLRERRALIQAVKRIGRLDLHFFEQRRGRFVLDDQREVLHLPAEPLWNERDRFDHQLLKTLAGHRRGGRGDDSATKDTKDTKRSTGRRRRPAPATTVKHKPSCPAVTACVSRSRP